MTLTDRQIDQLAADQAEQMHISGGYVLTVPMLRRLLSAAEEIEAESLAALQRTLQCSKCKVDYLAEPCPNRVGCPMIGEAQ